MRWEWPRKEESVFTRRCEEVVVLVRSFLVEVCTVLPYIGAVLRSENPATVRMRCEVVRVVRVSVATLWAQRSRDASGVATRMGLGENMWRVKRKGSNDDEQGALLRWVSICCRHRPI